MRILVFAIMLGLMLNSCGDMPSDKELASKLKSKILSGEEEFIMADLTDFKWDSLLILRPYSVPNKIEDKLDIDLSMIKYTGIDYGENTNILVFLQRGRVVNMVDYPRHPGDFSRNDPEFVPKSKAIFQVIVTDQKNINGDCWIDVVNVK